jgi:hypothetical protein
MNTKFKQTAIALTFSFFSIISYGQNNWNAEQEKVIETMNSLSKTTAPDGKGADAYGSYLSDDFNRWTIGSSITNNKEKWVEGVREWFDDGWRVSERKQQNIEILIIDGIAHTRRIVIETYLGPKGDISESKAALSELWIKKNNKWLLYRVNVHPMPND